MYPLALVYLFFYIYAPWHKRCSTVLEGPCHDMASRGFCCSLDRVTTTGREGGQRVKMQTGQIIRSVQLHMPNQPLAQLARRSFSRFNRV